MAPRHSAVVRITHWITTLSFFGLLVSGIAILLAHPRLYWGETGGVGTPSLIDLPLPFVLVGQSGWGRYLHFLCRLGLRARPACFTLSPASSPGISAKTCCLGRSGLVLRSNHSLPERTHVLQRLATSVVFVLFPLMIWTGLAMSPAITSVFPALVTVFGGQQSARTIHFFVASLSGSFSSRPHRHGLSRRFHEPRAGHDHRRSAAGKEPA